MIEKVNNGHHFFIFGLDEKLIDGFNSEVQKSIFRED